MWNRLRMSLGGKVVISGIKMTTDLVETVLVAIWIQKKWLEYDDSYADHLRRQHSDNFVNRGNENDDGFA